MSQVFAAVGVGRMGAAERPRRPRARVTDVCLAFAGGIALAWGAGTVVVAPWIAGAVIMLSAAVIARRSANRQWILLLAAAFFTGGAWVTAKHQYVPRDDLAALIGAEPRLIRAEGVAETEPVLQHRTRGSMARYDYRPPATYFRLRIDTLYDRHDKPYDIRGKVLVRADQSIAPFRAGDRVRVTGYLRRPGTPENPGEFNFQKYARSLGQAGILTVTRRELVEVTPAHRSALVNRYLDLRETLQRRATGWLLAHLPETDRTRRDALLAAVLLGERDADLDDIQRTFQRVGLAHLLAISGLHLGVLAGVVMLIVRWTGRPARWHGLVLILVTLSYLFLIEVRLPVLRAAVMLIAASIGLMAGRRMQIGGLIALSGVLLLLWRPDQLFNAGFQLSYGVVLGLVYVAPRVRERWFGKRNNEVATVGAMSLEWLKDITAASVTAWLIASPLVAYHFGLVAVLAAPLSVVVLPVVALLLALGYLKMVLSVLLPSVALLTAAPLAVAADVLLSIVYAVDSIPISTLVVPYPSILWTLCALLLCAWWGLSVEKRHFVRWKLAALGVLLVWLFWPVLPVRPTSPLRIDMLAVGDGSCYVVRSSRSCLVFDAGSSTNLNAGRRMIVPALRHLNVRTIEAIAISHPNMDHYSAVIELADEFNVQRVFVTPQFRIAAERDPYGPMADLMDRLTSMDVLVQERSAGDSIVLGEAEVTWLHPPPVGAYPTANDTSMVMRFDANGKSLLLTGDVQEAAIAELLGRLPPAQATADLVELPHHGSFNEPAVELMRRVDAAVVMQSTGWSRWQRDRWMEELADRDRLITARSGACSAIVERDGTIRLKRFAPPE